ncbi:hypothetical protein AB1Y20_015917 [Prymnesium parvum]|uniref:DNA polymerase eta n=1 Tax=Prymnesium parvum TaxID=97485 RepID=A0AB34JZ62_PRYPA
MDERLVALIDMDCFYCACERALDPSLVGVPLAVVQYNPFQGDGSAGASGVISLAAEPVSARVAIKDGKVRMPSAANGSIIAVSYEARARGVTRFFRAREALATCPEIVIIQVPTAHGKSDMGVYRDFGARTLRLIGEVCGEGCLVEKASVDEMYLDLTAPARRLLAAAGSYQQVFDEAAAAGTHVAGAAEAEEEASRGAQPGGVLSRSSFRAGHTGQVHRDLSDASADWWAREAPSWTHAECMLAAGAVIVARARSEVFTRYGFTCSAGIASNKMLAKLAGGLHKPAQQTVIPPHAVRALLDPLPVDRLRGFGGKLGELLRGGKPAAGLSGFSTCLELREAGVAAVARVLAGEWAHPEEAAAAACRMAAGKDDAPVEERKLPKQVGSSKVFSGSRQGARGPLDTRDAVEAWVAELSDDIASRLALEAEENGRAPTTLIVSIRFDDEAFRWSASKSRRAPLRGTSREAIGKEAMALLMALASHRPASRLGVSLLALTVDGFQPIGAPPEAEALRRMLHAASTRAAAALPPSPSAAREKGEGAEAEGGDGDEAEGRAGGRGEGEEAGAKRPASPEPSAARRVKAAGGGGWSCRVCTLRNDAAAGRCAVCDALRGSSLAAAATLAQQERRPPAAAARGAAASRGGRGARGRGGGVRPRGIETFFKPGPPTAL